MMFKEGDMVNRCCPDVMNNAYKKYSLETGIHVIGRVVRYDSINKALIGEPVVVVATTPHLLEWLKENGYRAREELIFRESDLILYKPKKLKLQF